MLKGYSNFDIKLVGETVVKSAKNEKDYTRLTKEIRKQLVFDTKLYGIKTPKIIGGNLMNKSYTMKYISDSNLILMLKHGINNNFINKLKRYFEINIKNSIQEDILSDFKEKYKNTYNNCLKNKYLKTNQSFFDVDFKFREMLKKINVMVVPVSYCHGDLTISNMLYNDQDETLYFIDFLANFSDTVLQDMVKIRQDTRFKLIMKMNKMFNKNVNNNLEELDKIFNKIFSNYSFYREYYTLFQYLNLLRVLPYCKKENIISYIINCMNILF